MQEWSQGQRQAYQSTVALYQAYLEACQQSRALRGGMHWKRIKGRDYLYRYHDRFGHGESLGPRSPHLERLFEDFARERREVGESLQSRRLELDEQARFCRAAQLQRLPRLAARILRHLEQHEPDLNLLVLGASALYAYECAAGVFLTGPETRDLLANSHRRLTLTGEAGLSRDDLVGLLRQTDRSFAPLPGEGCGAVNRDGFQVLLLKSGDRRPGRARALTVPGAREPLPPEAGNLQFLTVSPKLTQVVIGQDGWPVTMEVPDPRAFALNRLWLSLQAEHDAATRARDMAQALAVAQLVLRYLPQYDYFSSELEMFPRHLLKDAEEPAEDELGE